MRRSLVRDSKIKKNVSLSLRTMMCFCAYELICVLPCTCITARLLFIIFWWRHHCHCCHGDPLTISSSSPFATLVDCCCYPIPHHTTHPDKWANDQLRILDERPQCTVVSYLQINSQYGRGWKCDTAMTKYWIFANNKRWWFQSVIFTLSCMIMPV